MSEVTTESLVQKRVSSFVKWIAPKPEKRQTIKDQADEIRKRISKQAEDDNLEITSTPYAGSFAKKTGLKRHFLGESEVYGQDIDLPFVVKPSKDEEYKFNNLASKFYSYAKKAYPKTDIEYPIGSSVKMKFSGTGLEYDIVPLLATTDSNNQIIHKQGREIETSVQRHVAFMKNRTSKSKEVPGKILFNECVRLFKWWRYFQYAKHKNIKVKSIVIDMLCAKAFDNESVADTYIDTFAKWSGYLYNLLKSGNPIYFTDYVLKPNLEYNHWGIYDPTNNKNNFTDGWGNYQREYLMEWFEESRDLCSRILSSDLLGNDNKSLEYLIELFGNPFGNHCE